MLPGLKCDSEEQKSSRYYLLGFRQSFRLGSSQQAYCQVNLLYGVNDMLLKWLESFLVGRSQVVRVGSSISNSCAVLSGVPQGSVLGPILFMLMTFLDQGAYQLSFLLMTHSYTLFYRMMALLLLNCKIA
jgi:hypothetical protein